MTPTEAASAFRGLCVIWSTEGPDAAYRQLSAYTQDELRYLMMMQIGATAVSPV